MYTMKISKQTKIYRDSLIENVSIRMLAYPCHSIMLYTKHLLSPVDCPRSPVSFSAGVEFDVTIAGIVGVETSLLLEATHDVVLDVILGVEAVVVDLLVDVVDRVVAEVVVEGVVVVVVLVDVVVVLDVAELLSKGANKAQ